MNHLTRIVALLFLGMTVATAQTAAPTLSQLTAAIDKARQEQVDALAPRSFAAAVEARDTAARDAERGRDPQRIRTELDQGFTALQRAQAAAVAARETLRTVIATRTDALGANAPTLAAEEWARADDRFREAAAALEKNDLKNAQRYAAEADVLLRDVEMTAIRNGVVNEARGLIAQADAARVEKFAPRTIAAAKRHLSQAEQEINRNRYEPGVAVNHAAQASYEARHSMYLAKLIEATLEKKGEQAGVEELILSWEAPLREIAAAVDVPARFDNGMQPVMQELRKQAQEQQRENQRLSRDLQDRNDQLAAMNTEMEKLEARLGGVSQERIALQRRVDAQERLRANVARIESSFTADEARVYRQGEDVVISLTGIRFASGRSTIDAANAPLMNKVRDALALFPDSTMVMEGHTDANGTDSANLILSQDRADAVRTYLVNNFGISAEKISSIGYGETRPVASNETAEGRARNRRIDLIIHVR
ncbi:MAG TPA: OmpA family protein [Povalibacter sp.]|uniref:OmpA family protein n=1 Tax=Povalibacter sp. TaxID=1962978 RepID=UPI002B631C5E|nr:OmpA family protein [Povalibacter sp.]HMN45081.1 OmpA family protein [Povalibacter sp.]